MRVRSLVVGAGAVFFTTLTTLMMIAPGARAQADAGHCEIDGGTESLDGRCIIEDGGSKARFCTASDPSQGSLAKLPCSDFPLDDGTKVHGECEVLDGIGAWCSFPEDAPCAFDDGAGGTLFFGCGLPNDTFGESCDFFSGCSSISGGGLFGGTCALGSAKCFGNHLRINCTAWSQSVTLDCAAQNGVCDNANLVCVNGVGGECDNLALTCAGGLTCTGGRCIDPAHPPQPDAGFIVDSGVVVVTDAGNTTVTDAGNTTVTDAGNTLTDAGNTFTDSGPPNFGDAGSDPGTGVGLGDGNGGLVDEQPLEANGCGCGTSSAPDLALGSALFVAVLTRRQPRARPK